MNPEQQRDFAQTFRALHKRGVPLVLTNVWDAGSAIAVLSAGAPALATGSASVASAQGYDDGQTIPFELMIKVVQRITAHASVPVSVDLEAGFAEDLSELSRNVAAVIGAGAVGINIEDQVIGSATLHDSDAQAERLRTIRAAADEQGLPLFINARTDVFLREPDPSQHAALIDEAVRRANVYAAAGADGFFVPGLADPALIEQLCADVDLPINVMATDTPFDRGALASLGVSRISAGPAPFRRAMASLTAEAKAALSA